METCPEKTQEKRAARRLPETTIMNFIRKSEKKGGEATSKNHDHKHYEDIGSKGGKSNRNNQ